MYNIAIVGKMGAGKSSLANHLIDAHQYTRVANAGALKHLAEMAYGPIDKGAMYEVTRPGGYTRDDKVAVSGREILQGIGQTLKEFDRDIWLKAMVRDMATKQGPFVCDDTRFPFEAEFLRNEGWIIVKLYVSKEVRAERYERLYGRKPTEDELNHASETQVDDISEDLGFSGERPIQEIVNGIFQHMEWKETQDV